MEKNLCPELDRCVDRRVADAEFKGRVEEKLNNIGTLIADGFRSTWDAIEISRGDIKQIYLRVGIIAGGVSIGTSLGVVVVSYFINK